MPCSRESRRQCRRRSPSKGSGSAFPRRSCSTISSPRIVELPLKPLSEYATINAKGGFSPCEAYAWHEPHLKRRGVDYDPRVRVRIERGREMTAVDYVPLLDQRADLIARVNREAVAVDALMMPTLPLVAPP